MMQMKHIIFLGLTLLIVLDHSEGCPPHGARRKKRGVSFPTAPRVDERLSRFFGSCRDLVDSSRGLFKSLPSAVDYVLRDTDWYKNTSSSLCSGDQDNPQCWIYALDFLLDSRSKLFKSAAQCICQWSGKCYDPTADSHNRVKRSVPYEILEPVFPPPTFEPHGPVYPPTTNYPPEEPSYSIPTKKPTKLPLSKCIEATSKKFAFAYPSIRRVDGSTITTFLKDHYTYCRHVPGFPYDQRNLFRLLYSDRLCPRSGKKAAWRKNFSTLFSEATRSDGPMWLSYQKCEEPKDQCAPNPCKNGGKCRNLRFDRYECLCKKGYSGNHCEKRQCQDMQSFTCTYLYSREDCRFPATKLLCPATCGEC